MKVKFVFIVLFVLIFTGLIRAQVGLDSVLSSVARSNKTILASEKLRDLKILESRIGLNPVDPYVEYDYLKGSPATIGDQHELLIMQSFNFPTSYSKRNQLSKEKALRADLEFNAIRQDILLETKIVCVDLVYHRKYQNELLARKNATEKILLAFQTKLEKGDGTILDLNKARLTLVEIHKDFLENETKIRQLEDVLNTLNGGDAILFDDSTYFQVPDIGTFENLEKDYETNDPVRKILEQEQVIAKKQLELDKSLRFPKFELGYRYQDFPGQQFNGIHTGISIPLWENRNKVKSQRSRIIYADLEVEDHLVEHYSEIKKHYASWNTKKILLQEYEKVFSEQRNLELLEKALKLGEISSIEYFLEITFFYKAFDNYLITERDYYKTISELFKYKL